VADKAESRRSRTGVQELYVPPTLAEADHTSPISLHAQTPARILTGRAGPAYRTATWLELRRDHAAARDAVWEEFNLIGNLGTSLVTEWKLFEVNTEAQSKEEFLLHPERGRCLTAIARTQIAQQCPFRPTLQVAISDGLSAAAVTAQVPLLLPLLASGAHDRGWQFGQPFFIRHGRVGVLNDIGQAIQPTVAVLLIGERPGLATAVSLSAYMAFRPSSGQNDAHRNLISNIHADGVPADLAVRRIIALAALMMELHTSGIAVKEPPLPA
jgi:ethanolamine ammonia-lyase small subunit